MGSLQLLRLSNRKNTSDTGRESKVTITRNLARGKSAPREILDKIACTIQAQMVCLLAASVLPAQLPKTNDLTLKRILDAIAADSYEERPIAALNPSCLRYTSLNARGLA